MRSHYKTLLTQVESILDTKTPCNIGCDHPRTRMTQRIAVNGVAHIIRQCIDCYSVIGILNRSSKTKKGTKRVGRTILHPMFDEFKRLQHSGIGYFTKRRVSIWMLEMHLQRRTKLLLELGIPIQYHEVFEIYTHDMIYLFAPEKELTASDRAGQRKQKPVYKNN